MKRIFVSLMIFWAASAMAQATVQGYTSTYAKVCTLAQNKACTTATLQTGNLGGFAMQLWDSVKATTTGTLTLKVQGALVNKAAAFTSTGFSDSTVFSSLSVTAAAWTQIYDHTQYCPRTPFQRYIITNTGDSAWVKFYFFGNEDK